MAISFFAFSFRDLCERMPAPATCALVPRTPDPLLCCAFKLVTCTPCLPARVAGWGGRVVACAALSLRSAADPLKMDCERMRSLRASVLPSLRAAMYRAEN